MASPPRFFQGIFRDSNSTFGGGLGVRQSNDVPEKIILLDWFFKTACVIMGRNGFHLPVISLSL